MRVLAVDENPRIRDLMRRFLLDAGYQVVTAGSYADAKDLLASSRIPLVVAEIQESAEDQEKFSRFLLQHPEVHLILHTAWPASIETPLESVEEVRLEKHSDFRPLLEKVGTVLNCLSAQGRTA